MDEPSFARTPTEERQVRSCVDRAAALNLISEGQRTECEMDIIATHANGTPLNLEKLLNLPAHDFAHDITGMNRNMDQSTGRLMNHFRPKCALPSSQVDPAKAEGAE